MSGSLGDVGFFFLSHKSLSCYGDGGAITTNDKNMKYLSRYVFMENQKNENFDRIGLTGRLDTIQATVLLEKLKNLDQAKLRIGIKKIYTNAFKKNKLIKTQKIENIHWYILSFFYRI